MYVVLMKLKPFIIKSRLEENKVSFQLKSDFIEI